MSSAFTPGTGMFVRTPSWHRLENMILADWPGSWAEARIAAKLDWEPESHPVFAADEITIRAFEGAEMETITNFVEIPDWQQISRSDNGGLLSIQPTSYRMITNSEFGYVIESVLGMDLDEEVRYEGLFELYGGRMVVALVYFAEPLKMGWDPSTTMRYIAFASRHDGQGGLRGIPTNVRVVCANTWGAAEDQDGRQAFSIRHTANWDQRVAEVREEMLLARKGAEQYRALTQVLASTAVTPRQTTEFLKRLLPVGDDMGPRQHDNRIAEREVIRTILASPTCEGIRDTPYGLMQAAGEWIDHYRTSKSMASYVNRQLIAPQPMKQKALVLAKQLAGLRG